MQDTFKCKVHLIRLTHLKHWMQDARD